MNAPNIRPLDIEKYKLERRRFEEQYGVTSDRLFEPFTVAGQLIETDDFRRWQFVHGILSRRGH